MRVEVLENALKSDGYLLTQGDVMRVPDEVGRKWCALGWARDVDGIVPTEERIVFNAQLLVDRLAMAQAVTLEKTP